jgi:3-methylcrotonyl-CoA carboxylase beta subunit
MWPNARISVMGGQQAARVLSTVRGDMSEDERAAFEAPIIDDYEREGSPWYSTARLWDDGVIDPQDTRKVLALGLAAAMQAPAEETTYGVFRM